MTEDDPNDAFWLAQTFFMTHQYSRAERLLTRPFAINVPSNDAPDAPLPNGHSHPLTNFSSLANMTVNAKGKGKEVLPPMSVPRLPMGPGEMIEIPEDMEESVSRLVDMSVACRYLAAQCQVCKVAMSSLYMFICYSGAARELVRSNRNAWRGQPVS